MRFPCTMTPRPAGGWTILCQSPDLGEVTATAATRDEALEKMRGELRYRLELCPCTGESYQHIEIQLVQQPTK